MTANRAGVKMTTNRAGAKMTARRVAAIFLVIAIEMMTLCGCAKSAADEGMGDVDIINDSANESDSINEAVESESSNAADEDADAATNDADVADTDEDGADTQQQDFAPFERTASQTVDAIKIGWNLGNSLDAYGTPVGSMESETYWGNPKTTEEMIVLVKHSGFNAIRVPVTWYNHMDDNNHIDDEWMDRVEEVVGYCMDNDLYCIINVHHDTGENGWLHCDSANFSANKEKFTAIWEQVSARFEKYGDKLLFESFNEILSANNNWVSVSIEDAKNVNALNQCFVDTVRKSGGNNEKRCLVVNTYAASAEQTPLTFFEMPEDTQSDRLIAQVHFYQPYYFTAEEYPDVTIWSENVAKIQLVNAYKRFNEDDIPVIIGEFGCTKKDNDQERIAWVNFVLKTCDEYGFKCFWWDNGAKFSIFDRNNISVNDEPILSAIMSNF